MPRMNEKWQIYSKIRLRKNSRGAKIKGAKFSGARILMGIRYLIKENIFDSMHYKICNKKMYSPVCVLTLLCKIFIDWVIFFTRPILIHGRQSFQIRWSSYIKQ